MQAYSRTGARIKQLQINRSPTTRTLNGTEEDYNIQAGSVARTLSPQLARHSALTSKQESLPHGMRVCKPMSRAACNYKSRKVGMHDERPRMCMGTFSHKLLNKSKAVGKVRHASRRRTF